MDIKKSIRLKNTIKKLLVLPGVFLLFSCENDLERINILAQQGDYPELSAKNMEIIYSDSAKVEAQVFAPSIRQYSNVERPYIYFPEGIHVKFFNDTLGLASEIKANMARYYTEEKLWEAHGNVQAFNYEKGETLNTEELFWDENSKKIYSNSFSRIETADGTFYGQNGFESNQRFTRWKLKGSKGTVNFRETDDGGENP